MTSQIFWSKILINMTVYKDYFMNPLFSVHENMNGLYKMN